MDRAPGYRTNHKRVFGGWENKHESLNEVGVIIKPLVHPPLFCQRGGMCFVREGGKVVSEKKLVETVPLLEDMLG